MKKAKPSKKIKIKPYEFKQIISQDHTTPIHGFGYSTRDRNVPRE